MEGFQRFPPGQWQKKRVGGIGHEVSVMSGPVIGPLLRFPPLPHVQCGRALVEHYGLGVLVCHLGHMTEDIFFCDNTKEAPAERERERGGRKTDREKESQKCTTDMEHVGDVWSFLLAGWSKINFK